MASTAPELNPSLYLLKDHLDAALALGDDLLASEVMLDGPSRPGLRDWVRQTRNREAFLGSVRTLEYALTARLIQARRRAEDLKGGDPLLKPLLALLVAGTTPLLDAAAELGDADARDFDGVDTELTFLRSRGLLAADAAGLELVSRLAVGEDYLVAGRIPLGTLLDLASSFLEALDRMDLEGDTADDLSTYSVPAWGIPASRPVEPSAAN